MIYITGDTHIPIDIGKLSTSRFPEQKQMTKDDYLIICGDFGGVWNNSGEDKYWQNWLNDKPFTTLFVDGNHENFNLLNAYPVSKWKGGKIHKITDSVYHLMRGQVFTVNGIKIFTMGGASSTDMHLRKEGKSWWKEEMPDEDEYDEAFSNLDKCSWKVDLVISHCAPTTVMNQIAYWYEKNPLTMFLEIVSKELSFKQWYFGHYHTNKQFSDKYYALYNDIMKLDLEGN